MKVRGVNISHISNQVLMQVMDNADIAADDIVIAAKQRLLSGINPKNPPYTVIRKGRFSSATVSFVPKRGRNKGVLVTFNTDKRWTGRHYTPIDTLLDTIRRVNKAGSNSVRVYAGNLKAYWAFMVDKGYTDKGGKFHKGLYYLSGTFNAMKNYILAKLQNG